MTAGTAGAKLIVSLGYLGLLLPGYRAFAQGETADETGEETTKKPAAKSEPPAEPAPPAEPVETRSPAPAAGLHAAFTPAPPLRLENPNASIQFGLLAQPQFEMAGAPDADKTTKNLFVRRMRLMVSGTLFGSFDYFFAVDWPNLFKLDPADTMAFDKNAPGLNIQDAFVTYRPLGELIKVDAGFMLPPLSHNSLESAARLYGVDYFTNSFRRNVTNNTDPFRAFGQSPVGRDAGVQLRGLFLNGHIDVRVGMFMGRRVGAVPAAAPMPAMVGGLNMFRIAARLQVNLLDAEPGFFYQGSYHGGKKVLSLGGFYDFQDQYKYFGADLLADLPAGPGVFTAQAGAVQWDGGTFIPLAKQRVYMAQVGYVIAALRLSPIALFERLVSYTPMPDAAIPSEDRYGGGLAFWPHGHNANVKAFFTRVHRDPAAADFNQINVQWQLAF
jgi:hypothetical protein